MTETRNPGSGLVYYSGWASQSPISASNTTIISNAFGLGYVDGCSLQVRCDGGCAVDYRFQVSNVAGYINFPEGNAGPAIKRDDSYDSVDWQTLTGGSGTLAAGTVPASDMLTLNASRFTYGRVTFKYNSGGSGIVSAFLEAIGN